MPILVPWGMPSWIDCEQFFFCCRIVKTNVYVELSVAEENTADVGPVFAIHSFSHFEVLVHFNNFRSKERLLTVYTMGVMGVFPLRQGNNNYYTHTAWILLVRKDFILSDSTGSTPISTKYIYRLFIVVSCKVNSKCSIFETQDVMELQLEKYLFQGHLQPPLDKKSV